MKPSEFCRRRADECDVRSKLASDPEVKSEWAALSIEWHLLASSVVRPTPSNDRIRNGGNKIADTDQ